MEKNYMKISSWNLCLGIANKKDIVTDYLTRNDISICCMQETEVPSNYSLSVLNCNGYCLELEKSSDKMRVGVYLHKDMIYKRRVDLEEIDTHIVIIDFVSTINIRIINIFF